MEVERGKEKTQIKENVKNNEKKYVPGSEKLFWHQLSHFFIIIPLGKVIQKDIQKIIPQTKIQNLPLLADWMWQLK